MPDPQVIEADYTWTGQGFERGIQVVINPDGSIARVGKLGLNPVRHLASQALLPGMVNAHSHAFQRGLRGRGERFPEGGGSFWSWRDTMYRLVEELDEDRFHRLCVQAFREMLDSGITTVGEFHYVHHTSGTHDYAFDRLILDAALKAGIRIVLLNAFYRSGGIRQALSPAQSRFESVSLDAYWEELDRLGSMLEPTTQRLGAVAHSIRAASLDEIAALHEEATRRGLSFHIHIEEQRQEIEEALTAYGRRPLALLNELFLTAGNVTGVHCTHSHTEDMDRFLEKGGRVCVCPLTEANLGDGIPQLGRAYTAGGRLSLGTDSNAIIAMPEEMRWLEYGQRLTRESRGVFRGGGGFVARELFEIATAGGAGALGLETGLIRNGAPADFFTLDLNAPVLAGCDEETMLDALVFGAGTDAVRATCGGGNWREKGRRTED